MKDPKDPSSGFSDLRRRAEAQLTAETTSPESLSPAEAASLIHELLVHQIELEMQNEELRLSHARLEESRSKYADLYDFAPVGYLTLDQPGRIVEANLTAATLMSVERSKLLNRFFPHFLATEDRRGFRQLLNNPLGYREQRREVRLLDGSGGQRVMLLDILYRRDAEGRERHRLSMTDITELKKTQEVGTQHTSQLTEMNRQVQEANDSLEALFQAAPVAIALFDEAGRMVKTNPAGERIFGWSREAMEGRLPLSIPSDDPEESLRVLQRLLSGEPLMGVEFKQQRQDGAKIDISISSAPLHDQEGRSRGFVALGEDITQRKAAQTAIEESEARYRSLVELSPDAILVHARGRFVFANQAVLKLFGAASPEEILGQRVLDLVHPDFRNLVRQRLKPGERLDLKELRIMRLDGQPVEVEIAAAHVPFYGHPAIQVVVRDITLRRQAEAVLQRAHEELESEVAARTASLRRANEGVLKELEARRQAEASLAAERQRFLDLLKGLPAHIFLLAPDHTIRFANREYRKRFGDPGDQTCYALVLGRGEPCPDCRPTEVFQTGKSQEWEWAAPDGRTYQVYAYPFADTDGSPLVLKMGIDITQRKEAEEALKKNEALLRLILENLPVGVWLTDRDGRITHANPAARHIWGGARSVGLEDYGDYQGWWAVTGKSIAPGEWALARAIQKGETSLGEVVNIQGFDGSRKTIINSGAPLFGENREILGAVGVNQDITPIIKAQEIIREQGRQLEAFFAHSPTPLVFMDPQFNVLRMNKACARTCHHEAQNFTGHNFFEFYPHAESQAIFEEVVRRKTPHQAQAQPLRLSHAPEGALSYCDWALNPILNQAGEVDFLVFSLHDVTGQVLAEQARNRLIDILEATPDFVGIADYHGRLQYVNRAGRALIGLGKDDDLTGLQVADLHPHTISRLIQQKGVIAAISRGSWQAELALRHRDGREIPVSQVILAHKGNQGRVQFFSTIARDISDLKAAQASILRQSAIVNGINRIFLKTLSGETAAKLGQVCLSIAEALTDSRFGFIHVFDGGGAGATLALSDPGWDLGGLDLAANPERLKEVEPLGLLTAAVSEGQAIIANDPGGLLKAGGAPVAPSPLTAFLGVPLSLRGKPMGLIGLGNKAGGYVPADQEAVEGLAPAIVEALMHHRAEESLKNSEKNLRFLTDQLFTAQEDERKRLAAELHDELGHALLSLKLHLSSIEKRMLPEQEDLKSEIHGQIDYIYEVIQEVRRLYQDLSPGDVEDLGLTSALGTLISDFAYNLPELTWQVDLANMEGLFSLAVQTTIYRIMQEALTNIGKHANATAVTILARRNPNQVEFVVQDNGAGFDPHKLTAPGSRRGVGLVAMAERLKMLGGSLDIHSQENQGTRLSFTIPLFPEGAP